MATHMRALPTTPLILLALGTCAVALAVLFSFPSDPAVWQAATWTLVGGMAVLLPLVMLAGGILAMNPGARTWSRISSFTLGLVILLAFWISAWLAGRPG